ncbi:MAG: type II secretion system F family protein [Magnetococcales bacterium]|nr:type II secretion system F family protein [Magnetococcales bacterium]
MATYFRYKVLTAQGRIVGGIKKFSHDDQLATMDTLERSGATVIYSEPVPALLGGLFSFGQRLIRGSVGRLELAEGLGNMSVMLEAGMSLRAVVHESMVVSENKALSHAGQAVLGDVENGLTLAESAALNRDAFPELVTHLMRIGEETGRLEKTVGDAAEHLKRMDAIIGETKRALVMPAFTLAAILGAMIFWLYMVVPQMRALFKSFNVALPPLTQGVIAAATFLEHNLIPILVALFVIPLGLSMLIKANRRVRYQFHKLIYHLPIVGPLVQLSSLAFISEYISLMSRAGLDMMRALEIMFDIVPNELYREKIGEIRNSITRGLTLKESFGQTGVFPSFVVHMIGVGEQSGHLENQLKYIADEYKRRLNNAVDSLGKLIEPVSILLGGGFFALLAASMFLPIYNMIGDLF